MRDQGETHGKVPTITESHIVTPHPALVPWGGKKRVIQQQAAELEQSPSNPN